MANINLKITADASQAIQGINSVNLKMEQMQTASQRVSTGLVNLGTKLASTALSFSTIAAMVGKVVETAKELVTSYSVQEQAEVRLQSTLKATQQACGMSATELLNLADSLQQVTTYSDQEIIAAEQVLVATRKIGRDVMPEATKAILDMAAATGEDLTGAAQRLGQALADPAGEIESLKEANIQLTEKQAENIKKVQEQNGLYEAQKLLLQEVNNTYGGIAESLANTDTGKLEQLQDAWQDLKEGLGETLMNSLDGVLDYTLSLVEKIEGFVDEHNNKTNLQNLAQSVVSGSVSVDYKELTDEELQAILKGSQYAKWYDEASRQLPDFDTNRAQYEYAGVMAGALSEEDITAVKAVLAEMERRRIEQENASRLVGFNNLWQMQDISRNDLGFSDFPVGMPSVSDQINTPFGYSYEKALFNTARPYAEDQRTQSAFDEYIQSNGSLSSSYQIQEINKRITEGYALKAKGGLSEEQIAQIDEINAALFEQKKAFKEAEEEGETWDEKVSKAVGTVSDVVSEITSFNNNLSSLFSNLADNAIDALDEIESKWDEYFEDLDEKQERQRDSLNALLTSGNISYGDYIDSMNAMDEERAAAEEEALAEEEAARKKADDLNKAAFNAEKANSLAQAAVNAALSITDIWASYGSNPVLAGVLTGISAAATAAEIAAIASQQYTPLAAGGIVQSPTRALIGEGGSPEMILPLTDSNMERFGVSGSNDGGVINLVVNVGTAYNSDQLTEDIFRAIERAQRTGALPRWRYVA